MATIRVAYIPDIEEDREIFECPGCGELCYCLDPGDGLPTHIGNGEGYDIREVQTNE